MCTGSVFFYLLLNDDSKLLFFSIKNVSIIPLPFASILFGVNFIYFTFFIWS